METARRRGFASGLPHIGARLDGVDTAVMSALALPTGLGDLSLPLQVEAVPGWPIFLLIDPTAASNGASIAKLAVASKMGCRVAAGVDGSHKH